MKVDIFDFELNKDLIASSPVEPRDTSKLLDLSVEGAIFDRHFHQLPDLLEEGDILVFNDTKVIPAKLFATRGNAEVEITLYRPITTTSWHSFIKNSKRLKEGDIINIYNSKTPPSSSTFKAKVIEKNAEDGVTLDFLCSPESFYPLLNEYGSMPLPPYIKRDKLEDRHDKESYQTIYAKHEGAVAAPTAGLHFTDSLLKKLDKKGIKKVFLTLHVGAGTFLPVKVEDTKDHKMHSEYGIINKDAVDTINHAKDARKRIIAVGTTSLRLLETAANNNGRLNTFTGDTNIFITPGYEFKIIDMIITNFHLPKSTLFMLICAIGNTDNIKKAYQHAINNKYRFYSYGDSSIIKCLNKYKPS